MRLILFLISIYLILIPTINYAESNNKIVGINKELSKLSKRIKKNQKTLIEVIQIATLLKPLVKRGIARPLITICRFHPYDFNEFKFESIIDYGNGTPMQLFTFDEAMNYLVSINQDESVNHVFSQIPPIIQNNETDFCNVQDRSYIMINKSIVALINLNI